MSSERKIVTRSEAKAAGLKRYFTGKPCGQGHVVERRTKNGECIACRKNVLKVWLKENKDKAAKISRRMQKKNAAKIRERKSLYYKQNKDEISAKHAKCYEENKEQIRVRCRSYRERTKDERRAKIKQLKIDNPEKIKAQKRRHYEKHKSKILAKSKIWQEANPEKVRKAKSDWHKRNPENVRICDARRRSRELLADGAYTIKDVRKLLRLQNWRCIYCVCSIKKKKWHVDHIIPLSKGGGNGPDNIQILCAKCNLTKSSKDPIKFAQSLGLLL